MTSSIGAHIYTYYTYTLLKPMVYTMTSSIGAHISRHYTMLMPMVYTMTSWIGAHTYTLHYAHAHGIHDNKFDRSEYIYTTSTSSHRWYTR